MQNKCLRVISGAYRATPVKVLEAETQIAPMGIHLDQLQALARCRLRNDGQALLIRRACKRIKGHLQGRTGPRREKKVTPGDSKQAWLTHIVPKSEDRKRPALNPSWIEEAEEVSRLRAEYNTARSRRRARVRKWSKEKWQESWRSYRNSLTSPTPAQTAENGPARIRLHEGLTKAQSSLATQIRCEKIGLADFLHRQRVSTVSSSACQCGWHSQTAKHVIMFCTNYSRDDMLAAVRTTDYRRMINSNKKLKIVTSWLMRTELLPQYALAMQQEDTQ